MGKDVRIFDEEGELRDCWAETRMLTIDEVDKEFGDYLRENGIDKVKKLMKENVAEQIKKAKDDLHDL